MIAQSRFQNSSQAVAVFDYVNHINACLTEIEKTNPVAPVHASNNVTVGA